MAPKILQRQIRLMEHPVEDLIEGAETGRGKGLGIGLALVKEIVSLHGGSVEVQSEGADQGSEFFVRVPLARPAIARHGPLP